MKRFILLLPFVLTAPLAAQAASVAERFAGFDKNKDGLIAGEEMQAAPFLPKLDLNGDGSLTLEEAEKAVQLADRAKQRKVESPPVGKTGIAEFDNLDKNGDGLLTENEMPQKRWMRFLDQDNNGTVTLAEATEAMARLRRKGATPESPLPAIPADKDPELKEAPIVLKASDHGVGHLVADLALNDSTGHSHQLSERIHGQQGLIIAFFGATCPISGKLGPELARLEKVAQEQKVGMLLVCPVAVETQNDIQTFVTTHGLKSPVVHDQDGRLASALTATTTTEVFLLDAARTLIYRGAINDQYGLGYTKERPNKTYLRDALAAMLAHQAPAIAATTAPGCALDIKPATVVAQTAVTYHHQISRILQANCVECHRKDSIGPFSLETYEDVIENAAMIRKQVERGAMPPWFAASPPEGTHTPWINDSSLSPQDKKDLLTWLASDRPLGQVTDAPQPRSFPKEWAIGTPDAIIQLPKPIAIKAEGTMPYQFVTATTAFAEDRWVQGYEIMPTDRGVVHHVIVQVHPKGSNVRDRGEGTEGYWAAYVPGNAAHIWPTGFAKKLPAGAIVSFQIHYTPNGKKTEDQLRMGLVFAKEKPRYIVHTAAVAHPRLNIPAGAPDHLEVKEQTVPMDMNVMAYMAHMHVRGKAFKFEVTPPGGQSEVLLDIPRYDFNWQLRYDYAQPKFLPRGSQVKITAVFDNSEGNPANPDPTKNIRWGPQTQDEMMIGYFEYYTSNEDVAAR
ncbi:redoxin domain-containing protein [Prosthecobacter dejongeii]|uniref:Mono/diheme cytochrome c family protein n=1 Tax=Prosthecobacter dejongeii TaxID=48465 RepID=A0A7W8DP25_9BACT|nr:redoxin domain-containing protein [Prosthecobacter dejongeii]MBB5036887.1 mono/diheme cytochrome c family protein [Prosthecobacter dejongeii]